VSNFDSLTNNLFLIGSGFTKSVFPKAPLNADLLRSIIDDNPETLLRKYQIRYHTDDIEILLTRMDLETVELQSERLKQDRQKINEEIAGYIQQFRFGVRFKEKKDLQKSECRWLESLAKELFKENDAIITLNYDCFLEGLLDYYKVWTPKGGYCVVEISVPGISVPQNPHNIRVCKIHGSENFKESYVLNGQGRTGQTQIDPIIDETIYPISGRNSCLGVVNNELTAPKSYIIAPSFVKIPHSQIEVMMVEALCCAAKAKNFIIIGCGLRPEDSFLWLLLASFLKNTTRVNIQQSNYPGQGDRKKLFVEDLCAEKIVEKIRNHCTDVDEFVEVKSSSRGLKEDIGLLIQELHGQNSGIKRERNY